ncbi:MAG: hypothetical protein O8C61_05225 [Candidatus Methanoperedens sp.]|nr:hypothetical protein [Candidatus Methanoperedens sp.]
MIRKTIAVMFLLLLAILIVVPESFAYPQYGSSCSSCHGVNAAQNGMVTKMGISTAKGTNNLVPNQGNTQTGDILNYKMDPMRYTLGVIGTGLVVISQFYSIRKRAR